MSYAKAKQRYDEQVSSKAPDRSLMCTAPGCPNRWSVDSHDKGVNRLCTAHAWRDARRFTEAEVTAQQQDLDKERRFGRQPDFLAQEEPF